MKMWQLFSYRGLSTDYGIRSAWEILHASFLSSPNTLHIQRQITSNTRGTQGHRQVWQVDRCIVVKPDQDAGAMAVRTPRESGVISDSRSKYSFLGGGGLDRARETTSPELGTGKDLVISPFCLSVLSLKVFGCWNWLQPGKMCSKR